MRGHHIDSGFQFWQTISDVVHQEPVESLGQVGGPIAGSQGGILPLQERRLVFDGIPGIKTNKLSPSVRSTLFAPPDLLLVDDVLLGPVDHPDDPELNWNDAAAKDVDGVSAGVHQVQLEEFY